MSRRSLYRTSRPHTIKYGADLDQTIKHFQLKTVMHSVSGDDLHIGDDKEQPRQFPVKQWVAIPEAEYEPTIDGVESDELEFTLKTVALGETISEGDELTAHDIRGAVGGETIPGIASTYQCHNDATKQDELSGDSVDQKQKQTEEAVSLQEDGVSEPNSNKSPQSIEDASVETDKGKKAAVATGENPSESGNSDVQMDETP